MNPALAQSLRTAQILVAALLFGVISFTAVALIIGPTTPPPPPPPTMVTPTGPVPISPPLGGFNPLLLALGALMVAQLPLLLLLGVVFAKQAAAVASSTADEPDTRDRALAALWTNSTIVRAAIAEGTGLFGGVILLLHAEKLALAGVGFAVVVLLALMPTRGKLESWIQRAVQHAALAPNREFTRR